VAAASVTVFVIRLLLPSGVVSPPIEGAQTARQSVNHRHSTGAAIECKKKFTSRAVLCRARARADRAAAPRRPRAGAGDRRRVGGGRGRTPPPCARLPPASAIGANGVRRRHPARPFDRSTPPKLAARQVFSLQ
jgi:hypothetical protein